MGTSLRLPLPTIEEERKHGCHAQAGSEDQGIQDPGSLLLGRKASRVEVTRVD